VLNLSPKRRCVNLALAGGSTRRAGRVTRGRPQGRGITGWSERFELELLQYAEQDAANGSQLFFSFLVSFLLATGRRGDSMAGM
jgi:hypothetical protein